MKNKKAVFFSTDALIALIIILLTILIIYPVIQHSGFNSKLSEDSITTLSSLKIGEINNSYVISLINNGKITNTNQSILEQIGEFYAKEMPEAQLLASSVFSSLQVKGNIGIWIDDNPVFLSNSSGIENSEEILASRQIISGIEKGKDIKGYSSRAFLSHSSNAKYFYFGGYVGDGNITAEINYSGEIKEAKIEIAINSEFDLYINNVYSGHYQNSSTPTNPAVYDISAYLGNFHYGKNSIKFTGNNLYIAGGYIRIFYSDGVYESSDSHFFPGIEGAINLYDSFYVPGNLNSMSAYLHYNSPYKIFFNIGSTTVYNNTGSGETSVTINDSRLSSILSYPSLSSKTIPLRIGLENVSYITNLTKSVDVISVSDLSGSMGDCILQDLVPYCNYDCCRSTGTGCQAKSCVYSGSCNNQECGACVSPRPLARNYHLTNKTICLKTKLDAAKEANNAFIDAILNYSGNRVGLTAYQTSFVPSMSYPLSTDSAALKNKVISWAAGGTTCICCGINHARNDLIANSTSDKLKTIVIMSDGLANVACPEQGTGNPVQDAINAACTAHAANITVYAVGFGSDTDTATLQSIAACGGGKYYFSNVSEIVEVYQQIAQNVIAASYSEQTISVSKNISTTLYPDSYISFNYSSSPPPYGLAITSETENFGNTLTEGSFFVPEDAEIAEANVISYSGSRWTDRVYINKSAWQPVFSLSDFGSNYIDLGDPYVINIPLNNIIKGNNSIRITTGIAPGNSSGGSGSDKAIFTIIRPTSGYSPISSSALGCTWHVEFEDSSNSTINVPANYSGTDNCYYTSSLIEYNENDAIDIALYNLLSSLDLNLNHKIETKFSEQDLAISSNEVSGIPYTWNSEVQVRVWR